MTDKEYIELFHRAQVNLVAFKPVFHCDDELRRMVEMAIEDEREACAKVCEDMWVPEEGVYHWIPDSRGALQNAAEAIRARDEK
jgi:hypothetical protein